MHSPSFARLHCTLFVVAMLAAPAWAQNESAQQVQGTNARSGFVRPAIGFIDSPNAYCSQPDPAQDICYINWGTIYVDAAPNYMVDLSIQINGRYVARNRGFFQTSMTIPATMNDRGFKVACGIKGAGGDPDWGNAYPWVIAATDSAQLTSRNFGTAICPPVLYPTGPTK